MTISTNLPNNLIRLRVEVERERRRRQQRQAGVKIPRESSWTADNGAYINRETGRPYAPHHERERTAVEDDGPRYLLFKGGEGGGKSVAGIVKGLERLRRGMDGIMGSPDFEHFKRSLWPEFSRWCPWESVITEQRYRSRAGWEPTKPFTLTFRTPADGTATLYCGGFDDPGAWEGPNVNFAHFDEGRRHKTAAMLKVLDGRCRIPGPNGESPQIIITSTPRKNWLYEYFGPWERPSQVDPFAAFKAEASVVDLFTLDNERAGNLFEGFTGKRRQSLTAAEARVLLEAAWEDIDDVERFLPTMHWWDQCEEQIPELDAYTPIALAADAGVSNDTFGLVGVSRHPADHSRVAVRIVENWKPEGGRIDFAAVERKIADIRERHNVLALAFDPYQMVYMSQRLSESMWCIPFNQGPRRLEADKALLDLIMSRGIVHNGDERLRQHIDNADRKVDTETRKIRIVHRKDELKVDLAVATSMAAYTCLYELNL